jgi:histidinol-phosphate aminotransferase
MTISRRELLIHIPTAALLLSGLPGCSFRFGEKGSSESLQLKEAESRGDAFELSNNENPLGPSPLALAAIENSKHFRFLHRYSSHVAIYESFLKKLSTNYRVSPDFISVLPGTSDGLLSLVERLTANRRALVIADPDFYMISGHAKQIGAKLIEIQNPKGKINPREFIAHKKDAGLVYISNPNNPLGTFSEPEILLEIVRGMPDVPVLIDEAYIDFVDENTEKNSVLRFVNEFKNLIVARTFSKIYGLAGMRIGAIIANPEMKKRIGFERSLHWSVSSLGLLAADAALDDHTHTAAARDQNRKMRQRVLDFAKQHKIPVSETRSLCAQMTISNLPTLLSDLKQRGLSFNRYVSNSDHLRVTIGSEAGLNQLFSALSQSR